MENITAEQLKQIRAEWGVNQADFARLLGANLRTYQGWESERFGVPTVVAQHVATIQKLRQIYEAWDKFATPLAGTEEFDEAVDDHEKLWDQLFPELDRLTARGGDLRAK